MRGFSLTSFSFSMLPWVAVLLCLRVATWMEPPAVLAGVYEAVFCLALISSLWRAGFAPPRPQGEPSFLDL